MTNHNIRNSLIASQLKDIQNSFHILQTQMSANPDNFTRETNSYNPMVFKFIEWLFLSQNNFNYQNLHEKVLNKLIETVVNYFSDINHDETNDNKFFGLFYKFALYATEKYQSRWGNIFIGLSFQAGYLISEQPFDLIKQTEAAKKHYQKAADPKTSSIELGESGRGRALALLGDCYKLSGQINLAAACWKKCENPKEDEAVKNDPLLIAFYGTALLTGIPHDNSTQLFDWFSKHQEQFSSLKDFFTLQIPEDNKQNQLKLYLEAAKTDSRLTDFIPEGILTEALKKTSNENDEKWTTEFQKALPYEYRGIFLLLLKKNTKFIEKDIKLAEKLFEKIKDSNHPHVKYLYGQFLEKFKFVSDQPEDVEILNNISLLYHKAREKGEPRAMFALGSFSKNHLTNIDSVSTNKSIISGIFLGAKRCIPSMMALTIQLGVRNIVMFEWLKKLHEPIAWAFLSLQSKSDISKMFPENNPSELLSLYSLAKEDILSPGFFSTILLITQRNSFKKYFINILIAMRLSGLESNPYLHQLLTDIKEKYVQSLNNEARLSGTPEIKALEIKEDAIKTLDNIIPQNKKLNNSFLNQNITLDFSSIFKAIRKVGSIPIRTHKLVLDNKTQEFDEYIASGYEGDCFFNALELKRDEVMNILSNSENSNNEYYQNMLAQEMWMHFLGDNSDFKNTLSKNQDTLDKFQGFFNRFIGGEAIELFKDDFIETCRNKEIYCFYLKEYYDKARVTYEGSGGSTIMDIIAEHYGFKIFIFKENELSKIAKETMPTQIKKTFYLLHVYGEEKSINHFNLLRPISERNIQQQTSLSKNNSSFFQTHNFQQENDGMAIALSLSREQQENEELQKALAISLNEAPPSGREGKEEVIIGKDEELESTFKMPHESKKDSTEEEDEELQKAMTLSMQ